MKPPRPLPATWPFPLKGRNGVALVQEQREIPGLLGWWTMHTLGHLTLEGAAEPLGAAFGRGGIQRVGDVVIRPYRRGGLVRFLTEDRYLSARRFAEEYAVHWALWAAGFPTVEPLGFGYRKRPLGVEGVYLTRFTEAVPWPRCWERSATVIPALGVMLKALADWGLWAPDLNATNVLLTSDDRVLTLDWDRAQWCACDNLGARYTARLIRSLEKLQAPPHVLREWNGEECG